MARNPTRKGFPPPIPRSDDDDTPAYGVSADLAHETFVGPEIAAAIMARGARAERHRVIAILSRYRDLMLAMSRDSSDSVYQIFSAHRFNDAIREIESNRPEE